MKFKTFSLLLSLFLVVAHAPNTYAAPLMPEAPPAGVPGRSESQSPPRPSLVVAKSAKVGLFRNEVTPRALGWRWEWEWSGAGHCLKTLGVDFEVVHPEDLEEWNGRILVLANVRNMSSQTVATIKRKKVKVLGTYMSSYRDAENGAWEGNNFALADLFGVDFSAWIGSGSSADRLVLEAPLRGAEILLGRGTAMLVKPRKGSQVLARWPGGEPAVVESRLGIYVGEDLFCPENSDSKPVLLLVSQLLNRLEDKVAKPPEKLTFSEVPRPPIVELPSLQKPVTVGLGRLEEETLLRAPGVLFVDGKSGLRFHRWTKGRSLVVKGEPYLEVLRLRENSTYRWSAYRGTIEIAADGTMINKLDFEEYLAGVVPSEVPSYFPPEALKTMCVVARTYGLSHLGRHVNYDVCSTVHCQVYQGLEKESKATNLAVKDTAGQTLQYQGKPINAVFHAVCGGATATPSEVWGGVESLPYLPSRADQVGEVSKDFSSVAAVRALLKTKDQSFCRDSGRFRWERSFSDKELLESLRAGLEGTVGKAYRGLDGPVRLTVKSRGPSGRVTSLEVAGAKESYEVKGDHVRWLFSQGEVGTGGLQSSLFQLEKRPQGGYRIVGGGWGHGVGLCQQGAAGRASAGQSYLTILEHYYPGTKLSADPKPWKVTMNGVDR